MSEVAVIDRPQHKSVLISMADRYGMEPAAFEATVKATCMKDQQVTREQFAAFLLVAKDLNLNPILKEIYAFPTRGGGIQPIVGVDGWVNLVNSQPQCDGVEFEDHLDDGGALSAITCRIYRKDRTRPTSATEYMVECRRSTDTWKQWPRRMLRHKALIQAARYAFGFSGIVDPDEWERAQEVRDITPEAERLPAPKSAKEALDNFASEDQREEDVTDIEAEEVGEAEAPAEDAQEAIDESSEETDEDPGEADNADTEPTEADKDAAHAKWRKDLLEGMDAAKTLAALENIWSKSEGHEALAFPGDAAEAAECYQRNVARLKGKKS